MAVWYFLPLTMVSASSVKGFIVDIFSSEKGDESLFDANIQAVRDSARFKAMSKEEQQEFDDMVDELEEAKGSAPEKKLWSAELRSVAEMRFDYLDFCFKRNLKQVFDEGRLDRLRACGRYYVENLENPSKIYYIRRAIDDQRDNLRAVLPELRDRHTYNVTFPVALAIVSWLLLFTFARLAIAIPSAIAILLVSTITLGAFGRAEQLQAVNTAVTRLHVLKVEVDGAVIRTVGRTSKEPGLWASDTSREKVTFPKELSAEYMERFREIIDDLATGASAGIKGPNYEGVVPIKFQ